MRWLLVLALAVVVAVLAVVGLWVWPGWLTGEEQPAEEDEVVAAPETTTTTSTPPAQAEEVVAAPETTTTTTSASETDPLLPSGLWTCSLLREWVQEEQQGLPLPAWDGLRQPWADPVNDTWEEAVTAQTALAPYWELLEDWEDWELLVIVEAKKAKSKDLIWLARGHCGRPSEETA